MQKRTTELASEGDLRSRAVSRLTGDGLGAYQGASQAFGVLYELAASPSTAADALALLHELQVHQVELDLQAEELRGSRAELEAALRRQVQLYDSAPVGYLTVEAEGVVRELNLGAAALLGRERQALLGQTLFALLEQRSARELRAVMMSVGAGQHGKFCVLQLSRPEAPPRIVYATVSTDPGDAGACLVALMDAGAHD